MFVRLKKAWKNVRGPKRESSIQTYRAGADGVGVSIVTEIIRSLPVAEHGNNAGEGICMTCVGISVGRSIGRDVGILKIIRTCQGTDRDPRNCLRRG